MTAAEEAPSSPRLRGEDSKARSGDARPTAALGEGDEHRPSPEADDGFDWMMVEIFGHRQHFGRGKEVERFGSKMLRIDVPQVEWSTPAEGEQPKLVVTGWTTMFYGGASIFSNALTDERTVLKSNAPYRPAYRAALPAPADVDDEPEIEF